MNKNFKNNRLEAISDGIFAIAMTLLVLELKLPEASGPMTSGEFKDALIGQLPHCISWLVSFSILCRLWIIQHALLEQGEKKSRGFTALNFVFLGAISFIPFPTSLISQHPDQLLSVMIFSATYVVAGLAVAGMWYLLEKQATGPDIRRDVSPAVKRVIIGMPVIAMISCLLAIVNPRYGIFVWIVFPFIGIIIRRKKEKIQ